MKHTTKSVKQFYQTYFKYKSLLIESYQNSLPFTIISSEMSFIVAEIYNYYHIADTNTSRKYMDFIVKDFWHLVSELMSFDLTDMNEITSNKFLYLLNKAYRGCNNE